MLAMMIPVALAMSPEDKGAVEAGMAGGRLMLVGGSSMVVGGAALAAGGAWLHRSAPVAGATIAGVGTVSAVGGAATVAMGAVTLRRARRLAEEPSVWLAPTTNGLVVCGRF